MMALSVKLSPDRPTLLSITNQTSLPHRCKKCPRKFRCIDLLQQHTRQHSGQRPYTCPVCPRRFTSVARRNHHAHRHNRCKELPCPHCQASFLLPLELKKHLLYQHGMWAKGHQPHQAGNTASSDFSEEVEKNCLASPALEPKTEWVIKRDGTEVFSTTIRLLKQKLTPRNTTKASESITRTMFSSGSSNQNESPTLAEPINVEHSLVSIMNCRENSHGHPKGESEDLILCNRKRQRSREGAPQCTDGLKVMKSNLLCMKSQQMPHIPNRIENVYSDLNVEQDIPAYDTSHLSSDNVGACTSKAYVETSSLEPNGQKRSHHHIDLDKVDANQHKLSLICSGSPKGSGISPLYACREEARSVGQGSPPSDTDTDKSVSQSRDEYPSLTEEEPATNTSPIPEHLVYNSSRQERESEFILNTPNLNQRGTLVNSNEGSNQTYATDKKSDMSECANIVTKSLSIVPLVVNEEDSPKLTSGHQTVLEPRANKESVQNDCNELGEENNNLQKNVNEFREENNNLHKSVNELERKLAVVDEYAYCSPRLRDPQRLQRQFDKIIHLRRQVCQLISAVFPDLVYPCRFQVDTHAVEKLMDQIIAVVNESKHTFPVHACNPDLVNNVRVILCAAPKLCLFNLRMKVYDFLRAILPNIQFDKGFNPTSKSIEKVLDRAIHANSIFST